MRLLPNMLFLPAAVLLGLPLFASAQILPPPQLNKVYYQFTEERWATTNTAKVTVNFDAALDKVGLSNVNTYLLTNLNKIADKADWHIIEFSRTKDSTELEKVHVVAEARLPQSALASLRDKAKTITKPGEAYTIADIDFSPSATELEKAHIEARAAIYEQAKQETARLNTAYPDQKYFLNEIRFNPPEMVPMMKTQLMAAQAPAPEAAPAAVTTNVAVDAKIVEVASVTIASLAPEHPPTPSQQ